jgi:hypothetical protein
MPFTLTIYPGRVKALPMLLWLSVYVCMIFRLKQVPFPMKWSKGASDVVARSEQQKAACEVVPFDSVLGKNPDIIGVLYGSRVDEYRPVCPIVILP